MTLMASVGDRNKQISLQNPGPSIPNGDGGSTQTWFDLAPPTAKAAIRAATSNTSMESAMNNTISSDATHVIEMLYHPQVTTKTRVLYNGQSFAVVSVDNVDQDDVALRLGVVEHVP